MAKVLTLTHKGKEYTLEYTRKTVGDMERAGFRPADLEDGRFISVLPRLFRGAFRAHHRQVSSGIIEEIYDNMPRKEELFNCLVQMYNDPINELLTDPEDGAGNADWTASW